jgi:hypothetical protein
MLLVAAVVLCCASLLRRRVRAGPSPSGEDARLMDGREPQ